MKVFPRVPCCYLTFQKNNPFPFRNKDSFYGEELLAPRPTPKLEDHPLLAVRDCSFNIFAVTLHIESRTSIRNLRTRHAVATGTHLSRTRKTVPYQNFYMFLTHFIVRHFKTYKYEALVWLPPLNFGRRHVPLPIGGYENS